MSTFATTRVEVVHPGTGQRSRLCRGPLPDGACSAPESGRVCRRGCTLVAELAGQRNRVRLIVPAGLQHCPLTPVGHPWAG